MTIPKIGSASRECAGLINCTQLVLRLTHDEIREGYSNNPLYLTECIENGIHQNSIEIRFDDKRATLSCSFDANNICITCHIFLDNVKEIFNYITYLQNTYSYDFIRCCWLLTDKSYLSVRTTKDDIFIVSSY